jgi:hypothetical protein
MTMLARLVEPFTELVRWGEPWDVEDDDALLESYDDAPEALSFLT